MPFIVPGVTRYNVNGLYLGSGRPTTNIVDIRSTPETAGATRNTVVAAMAEILLDEYDDNLRTLQIDEWQAQSVSWVDLHSADGTTGLITGTGTNTWPASGGVSGEAVAFGTAALVRKSIVADRSRRQGRLYWPGIPEAAVSSGYTIAGANLAIYQTAWTAFFDALQGVTVDVGGTLYASFPCVVHILTYGTSAEGKPVPLTGDSRDVSAFSVQNVLATQRRRLRG
jgi:hypothetical protein